MKRIVLLFIILLLFVVLTNLLAYAGLESFTPNLRGLYKPHLRSVNNITEHYTNKYGLQVNNLLRKYNIF
jgi:hypothetical protein